MGQFRVGDGLNIEWHDRDLHTYRLTLPEHLNDKAQRHEFYARLNDFVFGGPSPLFALIHMTAFRGGLAGLADPEFQRQRETKNKVKAVAIVTRSASAGFVANTVANVFRSAGQWHFFDDIESAEACLRQRAHEELERAP